MTTEWRRRSLAAAVARCIACDAAACGCCARALLVRRQPAAAGPLRVRKIGQSWFAHVSAFVHHSGHIWSLAMGVGFACQAGNAPHRTIIDTCIDYTPDPGLEDAMNECRNMFDVRVRAMRAVEADRMLPKYDRLGMARIAWLFHVSERILHEWRDAYRKGAIGALQSRPGNRGQPQKADRAAREEAEDAGPARSARADAARNAGRPRSPGMRGGRGRRGGECPARRPNDRGGPGSRSRTARRARRASAARPAPRRRQGRGGTPAAPQPPSAGAREALRCTADGRGTTTGSSRASRAGARMLRAPKAAAARRPSYEGLPASAAAPPHSLPPQEFGREAEDVGKALEGRPPSGHSGAKKIL